jgi:hypothetical protein
VRRGAPWACARAEVTGAVAPAPARTWFPLAVPGHCRSSSCSATECRWQQPVPTVVQTTLAACQLVAHSVRVRASCRLWPRAGPPPPQRQGAPPDPGACKFGSVATRSLGQAACPPPAGVRVRACQCDTLVKPPPQERVSPCPAAAAAAPGTPPPS